MKMLSAFAVTAAVFAISTQAFALPRGYGNYGRDYLEGSSDLSHWSCGLYSEGRERDVVIGPVLTTMDVTKFMGYIGYDLAPWATIYVTLGGAQTTLGNLDEQSGEDVGFGVKFNLLDHEVMDPTFLEDRIRINAGFQFSLSSAEWMGSDESYRELSGSLTLGLINDIEGNALFLPKGIGIFAGGVFSDFVSGNLDPDTKLGYTAGIEIYYTERITLEFRLEGFEEIGYSGGVHLRL